MDVAQEQKKPEQVFGRKPHGAETDDTRHAQGPDAFDDARGRRGGGLFHRFGSRFQEALETSRGTGEEEDEFDGPIRESIAVSRPMAAAAAPAAPVPNPQAEEAALRRAREVKVQRVIIPEGTVISGSLTSNTDTEISGKIEGDVSVEGRLFLGGTAFVTGNVRAGACKVEGKVDGKVECSQELEIGDTGRLNADATAGRKLVLAGEVNGNISTGGMLRLLPTARIAGDIRARSIVIEEGAFFNGKCTMRSSAEKQTTKEQKE